MTNGIEAHMKENNLKAGVRIDGGRRTDLNKERVAARMAGLVEHAPTAEQEASRRKAMEKRNRADKRDATLGHDGARLSRVKVKLSSTRSGYQTVRSKPGTFEWRYGRDDQDALFHAGNHLAILWERAGMTIASSANFLRGTASGYATGLADSRAQAIDQLDGFRDAMGEKPAERLIDYCVLGMTTAEIARKDGAKERDMAPVLHQHLRDCARHFKFMGKGG
jgi:hypothetical protein